MVISFYASSCSRKIDDLDSIFGHLGSLILRTNISDQRTALQTALPHWPLCWPITAALYFVLSESFASCHAARGIRLPKLILHSDLRRRAASRRAHPRTSSSF